MNDHEISDVLDRLAPHGPEPTGWAVRAVKRSNRRRMATAAVAVVVAGFAVVPVVTQLSERQIPTVLSTPSPSSSIDLMWPLEEPPEECHEFEGLPDVHRVPLGEVIGGFYCLPGEDGHRGASGLGPDDLLFVSAMEMQSGPGTEDEIAAQVAHLWLFSASGDATSVVEDADGRYWWRTTDGNLMVWTPQGSDAADVEGTLTTRRLLARKWPLKACWQEISFSTEPLTDAVEGVVCDPTGATLEEVEQQVPENLVQRIVEQANSSWVPVSGDTRRGNGRSIILMDGGGAAFYLHQLTDGTLTWQQPDGSDLQWTPSGDVAEALTDLGMKYLTP